MSTLYSKGTSSTEGYTVEVCTEHFIPETPVIVMGKMVTDKWSEVRFAKGANPAGVPADNPFGHHLSDHGLLPFCSATALAWTLHAQHSRHGLKTRIIKHQAVFTHDIQTLGVVKGSLIHTDLMKPTEVEPS